MKFKQTKVLLILFFFRPKKKILFFLQLLINVAVLIIFFSSVKLQWLGITIKAIQHCLEGPYFVRNSCHLALHTLASSVRFGPFFSGSFELSQSVQKRENHNLERPVSLFIIETLYNNPPTFQPLSKVIYCYPSIIINLQPHVFCAFNIPLLEYSSYFH